MSSTSETENAPAPVAAADAPAPEPGAETPAPAAAAPEEKVDEQNAPAAPAEPPKPSASSWLNAFALPPNLSTQLTTFSSSLLQVTSKVSAAANNLVQKTLPQRPATPTEGETTEGKVEADGESKESNATNVDLTSK